MGIRYTTLLELYYCQSTLIVFYLQVDLYPVMTPLLFLFISLTALFPLAITWFLIIVGNLTWIPCNLHAIFVYVLFQFLYVIIVKP